MADRKVSERTIRRLSHYARCLRDARSRGDSTVTSSYLSRQCGISSAAVRKDLTVFGEFGKQGSGYDVDDLLAQIERILGTCDSPSIIIIGAGNIGRALLESGLECTGGYSYSAIFDIDPDLVGTRCAGHIIKPIDDIRSTVSGYEHFIAVIAVTTGEGQKVVNRLAKAGCRAMLSFNLEPLELPEGVELRYMEMSTELDMLTHSMKT
ncbi:MAG: redox-sensing transcriptional repressor Rex [Candidatus Aegiribacteria sp.]|nr:redox-sensing transcriptional repressor Rex [Candidatus Aegiribacteria sp.]